MAELTAYRVGDDLSYYLGPSAVKASAEQCEQLHRNVIEAEKAVIAAPAGSAKVMPKLKTGHVDRLIGTRLKQERERQQRTLDDVATKAGTSLQMLHKYEAGTARIYVERLVLIAKALGKPTRFFTEGKK